MDILFFLAERTGFIRNFYDEAGASFRETLRKIEVGEAPFFPVKLSTKDLPTSRRGGKRRQVWSLWARPVCHFCLTRFNFILAHGKANFA